MNTLVIHNIIQLTIYIGILIWLGMKPYTAPYNIHSLSDETIVDMGFRFVDRIWRVPQKVCYEHHSYDILLNIFIILFLIFGLPKLNINQIIATVATIVILYLLKRLLSFLTILPNPSRNKCFPKHHKEAVGYGACNDLFFSGHFIPVNIIGYILWNYLWSPIYFALYTIFYVIMVFWTLSCQYHYTIDIIAGIPISLVVAMFVFGRIKN